MTPSDTAHPEGARDAMARLVGSWTVTGGVDDDDHTVIHDVFPGGYDQRTDRLYALTDAILAAVATPPSRPQGEEGLWRPISEAPRDGTPFDAWVPDAFGGRRMVGLSFNRRGELRQHGLLTKAELPRWPTHWQPLPAPPALSNQGKPSS